MEKKDKENDRVNETNKERKRNKSQERFGVDGYVAGPSGPFRHSGVDLRPHSWQYSMVGSMLSERRL